MMRASGLFALFVQQKNQLVASLLITQLWKIFQKKKLFWMRSLPLFMSKKKNICLGFFLLFFLSSCSFLLDKFDQTQRGFSPKSVIQKTLCEEPTSRSLVGESERFNTHFVSFLDKLNRRGIRLNFIDKVVLLSLLNMNLRPDVVTPTSAFTFYIRDEKGEEFFFDFRKKSLENDSRPWSGFWAFEYLLKTFKSRFDLANLISMIERDYSHHFEVTSSLGHFFGENVANLRKNKTFASSFFINNEVLRVGETLPDLAFSHLWKSYRNQFQTQNNDIFLKNTLMQFKDSSNQGTTLSCNFDMNLYDNTILLISEKDFPSYSFGYQEEKTFVLVSSSQDIGAFEDLDAAPIFKGNSNIRPPSLCHYHTDQGGSGIFMSTKGRDPGQHLYHLFVYSKDRISSRQKIDEALKLPRHIFLTSPLRLIYESYRGNDQKLEKLLQLNFPIYHAAALGRIWGLVSSENDRGFVLDDRYQSEIWCQKKP